jgi:hypothetical protein
MLLGLHRKNPSWTRSSPFYAGYPMYYVPIPYKLNSLYGCLRVYAGVLAGIVQLVSFLLPFALLILAVFHSGLGRIG